MIIFDGDTLAYVRTVNLPHSGRAISYVESTDLYAILINTSIEYFNNNFGYVKSFRIYDFGNGPYQICTDENYVYAMFAANDGISRNVHVYSHTGTEIGKVAIQNTSNVEPTGISIMDGCLYISLPNGRYCALLKKLE